jgi:hypothetical protein
MILSSEFLVKNEKTRDTAATGIITGLPLLNRKNYTSTTIFYGRKC